MSRETLMRRVVELRLSIQMEREWPADDYNEADQWLEKIAEELREGHWQRAVIAWKNGLTALSRARFYRQRYSRNYH